MAHKRLAALAAAVVTLGTVAPAMADTTAAPTGDYQVTGQDRYATSVMVSQRTFKPGVDLVTIATGEGWVDSLAGAAVAANAQGPLLLTQPTGLPANVKAELKRLNPAAVLITGGTGSVTLAAQAQIQATVPNAAIFRDGGPDRYQTAARISADYYLDGASAVYIVSGQDYHEAVMATSAAGLSGGPLLLADKTLPAATKNELVRLKGLGVENVIVLGGTGSISPAVFDQINAIFGKGTDGYPVTSRVAGATPYATSVALTRILWGNGSLPPAKTVYYVNGEGWADALSAGPAAAAHDAPIVLTQRYCMPNAPLAWTNQNAGTIKGRLWIGGITKSLKAC